jgi:hypothetical protein
MSTSIHQQELDTHFDKIESEMTQQEVTETPVVYFRFDENSSLLTSTLLYKPRRS